MTNKQSQTAEHLIVEGPVLLDLIEGKIGHIRLNRPDASNGMSLELLKALHAVIMTCHGDKRITVILLSGEGKNFCAGGDVKVFASKGERLPDYLRETTAYLQMCVSGLMRLDALVIAMVHGYAAGGGGLGLVCSSDLVIAAESAKFLTGATRAGMAPDAGSSVTLARIIGFRRAMHWLLNNQVVAAREALDIGLVNQIVPDAQLAENALAFARQLAAGAPLALAATKRMLWNGVGLSVESALPEESRTVSELSGTADAREALAAIIEKRAPNFIGE